jgi:hypothetical protein
VLARGPPTERNGLVACLLCGFHHFSPDSANCHTAASPTVLRSSAPPRLRLAPTLPSPPSHHLLPQCVSVTFSSSPLTILRGSAFLPARSLLRPTGGQRRRRGGERTICFFRFGARLLSDSFTRAPLYWSISWSHYSHFGISPDSNRSVGPSRRIHLNVFRLCRKNSHVCQCYACTAYLGYVNLFTQAPGWSVPILVTTDERACLSVLIPKLFWFPY